MTTIIFGGTAAYHLKLDEHAEVGERRIIETPFGESAPFVHLSQDGREAWFSSRHGEDGLQRSATFVNHRANIWAARELGATAIFSWNGVGAITPGLSVGQMVVPDDVLDMTRARVESFNTILTPQPPLYSNGEGEQGVTGRETHDSLISLRSNIQGEQGTAGRETSSERDNQSSLRTNSEGEQIVTGREAQSALTPWAHTYKTETWKMTKPLAREMRKSPTASENALWERLRNRQVEGYKFRRQHPIDRFIVDFYCAEMRLVIEVDGPIHEYTQEEDTQRTELIESKGLRVIRFTNEQVTNNMDEVIANIRRALLPVAPHDANNDSPSPLLQQSSSPIMPGELPTNDSPSPLLWRGGRGVRTPSGKPFADSLRQRLITASASLNFPCTTHGTYVCTEGPRLETAAEISLYSWGGAAIVGMTLAPEIWLAAELGIPYASLCIITNMATGRWHYDPHRDFGPGVGVKGLQIMLAAM